MLNMLSAFNRKLLKCYFSLCDNVKQTCIYSFEMKRCAEGASSSFTAPKEKGFTVADGWKSDITLRNVLQHVYALQKTESPHGLMLWEGEACYVLDTILLYYTERSTEDGMARVT